MPSPSKILLSVSFLFVVLIGGYAAYCRISLSAKDKTIASLTQQLTDRQANDTIVGVGTVHIDSSQNENNHSQIETKGEDKPNLQSKPVVIETTYVNSYVEIDTFKNFGDTCNPLSVSVWARVWSDGKYRMLIKPKWNSAYAGKEQSDRKPIWGIWSGLTVLHDEVYPQIGLARKDVMLGVMTNGRRWGLTVGWIKRF